MGDRSRDKRPRDERGRFARIVEHMRGVTIMESRSTADDETPIASSTTRAEV